MKNGGLILWNASVICKDVQDPWQMGRLHTRDVLGNHLKDRSFRLVHWLCITLSLRKTRSISLERKSSLDCGEPFKAPIILFGGMVEYYPISARDQSRLHQLGKKVLPGILFGYALIATRIWKGNILVAVVEELEKMNESDIHLRRINAKEVLTPQRQEDFIFPVEGSYPTPHIHEQKTTSNYI